jgi:hypothetical protein
MCLMVINCKQDCSQVKSSFGRPCFGAWLSGVVTLGTAPWMSAYGRSATSEHSIIGSRHDATPHQAHEATPSYDKATLLLPDDMMTTGLTSTTTRSPPTQQHGRVCRTRGPARRNTELGKGTLSQWQSYGAVITRTTVVLKSSVRLIWKLGELLQLSMN